MKKHSSYLINGKRKNDISDIQSDLKYVWYIGYFYLLYFFLLPQVILFLCFALSLESQVVHQRPGSLKVLRSLFAFSWNALFWLSVGATLPVGKGWGWGPITASRVSVFYWPWLSTTSLFHLKNSWYLLCCFFLILKSLELATSTITAFFWGLLTPTMFNWLHNFVSVWIEYGSSTVFRPLLSCTGLYLRQLSRDCILGPVWCGRPIFTFCSIVCFLLGLLRCCHDWCQL